MWQLPYLQDVHTKSNNQINYLSGGINNIYPSQAIADDECQDMYNLCLDKYPAIRTRIGRTMVKNPGLKGNTIKYFGVAGIHYLFYIQKKECLKNTCFCRQIPIWFSWTHRSLPIPLSA